MNNEELKKLAESDASKLASAIADAATECGITDASKHSFSGPQLLMLLDDMVSAVKQATVLQQNPLTDEQRRDLQKVRDSLDPEDWCGDERMVDVLDRVLVVPCCGNFAAGTSCFADPKSNCPRLAVAHNIGEKK